MDFAKAIDKMPAMKKKQQMN